MTINDIGNNMQSFIDVKPVERTQFIKTLKTTLQNFAHELHIPGRAEELASNKVYPAEPDADVTYRLKYHQLDPITGFDIHFYELTDSNNPVYGIRVIL